MHSAEIWQVWHYMDLNDKKYTNADYNKIMCFCDNLPENSLHREANGQDRFSKIKDGIVFYKSIYGDECKFHIVGDLNARVGEMNDFIENDDVSYLPVPDDYIMDEPFIGTRTSKDKTINNSGKNLIDLCKTCDLRIVLMVVGRWCWSWDYTFMNDCGQSVIDYVLCSSSLLCHMEYGSNCWWCQIVFAVLCWWCSDICRECRGITKWYWYTF